MYKYVYIYQHLKYKLFDFLLYTCKTNFVTFKATNKIIISCLSLNNEILFFLWDYLWNWV